MRSHPNKSSGFVGVMKCLPAACPKSPQPRSYHQILRTHLNKTGSVKYLKFMERFFNLSKIRPFFLTYKANPTAIRHQKWIIGNQPAFDRKNFSADTGGDRHDPI